MIAEYVKPKNGLEGELVCSHCGAHPFSKNGSWVITRHCPECGARIIRKDHPWYEEERSRILYTCEEKYDGNMVMLVLVLEEKLKKVQAERDQLFKDVTLGTVCECCLHEEQPTNSPVCKTCNGRNNWVWRGMPDEKGSDQA